MRQTGHKSANIVARYVRGASLFEDNAVAYAAQIASEWNPTDAASGFAGFVTQFDVDADYLTRFEVKTVGASRHQGLWVPADELDLQRPHSWHRTTASGKSYLPVAIPLPSPRRALAPESEFLGAHLPYLDRRKMEGARDCGEGVFPVGRPPYRKIAPSLAQGLRAAITSRRKR